MSAWGSGFASVGVRAGGERALPSAGSLAGEQRDQPCCLSSMWRSGGGRGRCTCLGCVSLLRREICESKPFSRYC